MEVNKELEGLAKDQNGNLLPFTANGNRYTPLSVGSKVSVGIWRHYERFKMVLGIGRTFQSHIEELEALERDLGADRPFAEIRVQSILRIHGIKQGVLELSNERNHVGLYMCTLFIRADGDAFEDWSMEMADKYIEDWSKIPADDLFFFALSWTVGFKEIYTRLNRELVQKEQGGI
jgi:hypothetical protein